MSAPGVRMVTASERPATRISSGSSAESVSMRPRRAGPSSRITRRRDVVRPMTVQSGRLRRTPHSTTNEQWRSPVARRADPGERDSASLKKTVLGWPVVRQLLDGDRLGRGTAAISPHSAELTPRTKPADRVVQSICPYCAVGCGQRVYVKDEKVVQIEGDPTSPISRGRLCPKGSASLGYVNSPIRETQVKYRRPHGTAWESLSLEKAMDMIAERVVKR